MLLRVLIFKAMLWLLPPLLGSQSAQRPICARETPDERRARYESIAEDLEKAIELEAPRDPRFAAALVLGVTFEESRWHKHVDLGLDPATSGQRTGQWCLGQINLGKRGTTSDGLTGPELVASRVACFRETLRRIQRSFGACRTLEPKHWLSVYASGVCSLGHAESAKRMNTSFLLHSKIVQYDSR